MEKLEVTINDDKTTAKEVNPYKDELDRKDKLGHTIPFGLVNSFRSYESALRTFEIETIKGLTPEYINKVIPKLMEAGIGTKHKAEVLSNGRIRIL